MYDQLGDLLLVARERLGLDQTHVAAQLGVGQQAVSTWERGLSRPRRAMLRDVAALLQVAESALFDAGRYADAATPPTKASMSSSLPLASLPPDRFEDLAADLLQLIYPEAQASRFGGPGEKQFGIDILVVAKDGRNLATAQCKRRVQFGEAAVAAAVGAAKIKAEMHFLFLSRDIASPGARMEMGKYPAWQLWDGQNISRYIRSLPLDQAVRIVDTYFSGYRQSFLGVANPGPWLLPEDYFAHGRAQMVSHDWSLVGRSDAVGQLAKTLYGSTGALAAIVGRGGTGKTRLLRAVAEACPDGDIPVLVLPAGITVAPADFELIPSERRLVILIDDAHERDDLNNLLPGIWRRNPDARILIATRPYRWEAIRSQLGGNPLASEPVMVELGDLSLPEAEDLVREVLGDAAHDAVVHRLARLTRDCPLVAVVGGVLIRRGQLDPTELGHDDQVREVILRSFRNALVSDPMVVDPVTRNAVIDAVAALQPVRTDDQSFRDALSNLIRQPFDVLNRHLRSLEEAGILRRRGTSLRIVPDLLGDVIFSEAAYDERTELPTGYLDRVRLAVDGQPLQHLFVNVSRVDWQINRRGSTGSSLVDSLWEPLEAEMRQAGILERQQLVRLLARVAYFQPARVIALGRWLIDNPTDEVEDNRSAWAFLTTPTYSDVLNALPAMLKAAAYTFDTLPAALNLLWRLSQVDARPINRFPDHPMRVLQDLSKFEIGKPAEFNDAVVDAVSDWFASTTPDVSPFDVLEPMLATEGTRQTYQEYTLTFQPYPLNVCAVAPVRQRIIQLALQETQSRDVRRAVAGVKCLGSALQYPHGMYGRPVSDEERERWTPEFVSTIRQLGAVAATHDDLDPVVLVQIRKTLNWHATYSKTATGPAAETVVGALRNDLSDRIALIFHDGWGHLIYDREQDYQNAQEKIQRRLSDAVSDLTAMPDRAVIQLITERLTKERKAYGPDKGRPGPLVAELVRAQPSLTSQFIDLISSGKESALEPLLPVILATYAELDADAAIARAYDLLAQDHQAAGQAVAHSLGLNRGRRPLADGERALLMRFATDADPVIRQAPVMAAQRLAEVDPTVACQLLAAVDFSDNPELADELFMCFAEPFGLNWEMLTSSQVSAIRDRLVALPEIEGHWIIELLSARSVVAPEWVISLLQDRVAQAESREYASSYRPTPFNWGSRLRVREHPNFDAHLRQLHAWVAAGLDSWVRRDSGSEVFAAVARPYDEAVLAVFEEALQSDTKADIDAVAALLRQAHRTFIWDFPAFVRKALAAGARFGPESRDAMINSLWSATISGTRMGTPGQPFPADVEQRDRSLALAAQMRHGSLEETFYRDVAASAETSIARSTAEDREDDGRDW